MTAISYTNLQNSERGPSALTERFLSHSLEATSFGHREHVYVAYDLLCYYDFLNATVKYVEGIRALAASVGADDKFNMTITMAWLSVIAERISASQCVSCDEFLSQNADLLTRNVPGRFYSSERLNSAVARKQFLLPDLA